MPNSYTLLVAADHAWDVALSRLPHPWHDTCCIAISDYLWAFPRRSSRNHHGISDWHNPASPISALMTEVSRNVLTLLWQITIVTPDTGNLHTPQPEFDLGCSALGDKLPSSGVSSALASSAPFGRSLLACLTISMASVTVFALRTLRAQRKLMKCPSSCTLLSCLTSHAAFSRTNLRKVFGR